MGFFRVPSLITNEGEKANELCIEKRNRRISSISRHNIKSIDILKNECVCARHFTLGRPAKNLG